MLRTSTRRLADLGESVTAKVRINAELRAATTDLLQGEIDRAASAMADRFRRGGRLFTFGNGGSSTDVTTLAALFATPPTGPALPAYCLVDDSAVLTALGNDVGFSLVFSRHPRHAGPRDIAVGFSTSGNSEDLIVAFEEAARADVLTVGLAGYDGGYMARAGLDFCLVVGSDSVHRIQEVQAVLAFGLWQAVHLDLAGSAADA